MSLTSLGQPVRRFQNPAKDEFEDALLLGFGLLVAIVSAPSKNIYYVAPPLFLALALFFGPIVSWTRLSLISLAVCTLTGLTFLLGYMDGHHINIAGGILSAIMLLPILVLFSFDPRLRISSRLFERIRVFLSYYIFVQFAASVVEVTGTFVKYHVLDGDFVSGTLGLTDIFFGGLTISQVFFTFNIFCMIMFLLAGERTRLTDTAVVVGTLSCIVAQSGHQTVFFVALIGLLAVPRIKNPKRFIGSALAGVAILGLVELAYPAFLSKVQMWVDKELYNPGSIKRTMVRHWQEDVASPKTLLLGTGMGQFTGRGSLYSSGYAMRANLPSILVDRSDYFDDFVQPEIARYRANKESSAISQPYFSYLTLVSEFGIPAMAVFIGSLLARAARAYRKTFTAPDPVVRGLSQYQFIFIGLLLLCSTVENYLEFVQAIFVPVLLYGFAQGRIDRLSTNPAAT